ncbi:intercellular adhesion molecule 5-like isoform X2 [Lepisosteus oculatus]|uniref:intercellular adhesion molecule 5-like isoform X2 n=1 Tax=Lepisosteus oculatus TaxID=7918 RepID=UPI0035F51373
MGVGQMVRCRKNKSPSFREYSGEGMRLCDPWIICALGLLCIPHLGAVPECPLEISPQRAVVRYGDPVTANCTTTQTARGIGWEAPVGATGMKTGVQSVTWNVSSLTDWTVEPTCYGDFNTEPRECRKNLNISLYKSPDSVSLSSDGPVDQMVEGRQYQLQCAVQNIAPVQYLTVNWYRGQTLIHSQTFSHNTTRTPVNVSVRHLFTADRADNGQQFTCEAELNLGPEGPQPPPATRAKPLKVTVLYRPVITCPPSATVKEGQILVSSDLCTAVGNPPPDTQWLIEGQEIEPNDPLSRRDIGQFTFEAENEYGKVTQNVIITVEYGPEIKGCPTSIAVKEGQSLKSSVPCTAVGNPPPDTQWLIEGQEIEPDEPLSRRDIGQFTLEAENKYGKVTQNVNITVKYQPAFLRSEETTQTVPGNITVLVCSADGNPPPRYNWTYSTADNVALKYTDRGSTVTINGTSTSNIGIYTCFATNEVGEAQKTFKVEFTPGGNIGKKIGIIIGVVLVLLLIGVIYKFGNASSLVNCRQFH